MKWEVRQLICGHYQILKVVGYWQLIYHGTLLAQTPTLKEAKDIARATMRKAREK